MFSIDLKGVATSWNGSAELLFGYSATEMVGRFCGEILEGEELEDFEQVFAKAMAGERLSHHETMRTWRDGTSFDVSMSLAPILLQMARSLGSPRSCTRSPNAKQRARDRRRAGH